LRPASEEGHQRTAFPEHLLRGKKPEPTFLVEKPFRAEKVKALISQALFVHVPRPSRSALP